VCAQERVEGLWQSVGGLGVCGFMDLGVILYLLLVNKQAADSRHPQVIVRLVNETYVSQLWRPAGLVTSPQHRRPLSFAVA
jgi:hypothetical protein